MLDPLAFVEKHGVVLASASGPRASGKHVDKVTPFPKWVPADVARAAKKLTIEQARAALGRVGEAKK